MDSRDATRRGIQGPSRSAITGALAVGATAGAALVARVVQARRRLMGPVLPELRHPLLLVPLHFGTGSLRLIRRVPVPPTPVVPGVDVEKRTVPTPGQGTGVEVFVYEGPARPRPSGALLWIHGGGYVMGHPATYHELCSRFAHDLGILVVSVDYRLAPEHPFPAGLEDCHAALRWVHDRSEDLGVDPSRIAIGGDSAGGGLAAALAQLAVDRGEVPVCFQLLVYPMLDDRTVLRTDHGGTGSFVWTPESNAFGWTSYLGHPPRDDEDRPYAAPARRADLTGLPPAWIGVGDLDLFHAEDLAYAERLQAAGVPCQVEVVAGMYHAADALFRKSPAMTAFRAARKEALDAALTST
jgi:acetyl esterase/lipase